MLFAMAKPYFLTLKTFFPILIIGGIFVVATATLITGIINLLE
jgi:hypothetical protein